MSEVERPASPYVGLVPYSEAQAPFFFGREAERDLIIENLRASRLTLLYGTSGVGKSSVLNAGAAYFLRQIAQQSLTEYGTPEFVVVTFSAWGDDPVTGLMRSIQEAIAGALQVKSREAVPESRNLAQMMGAWSERYGIELLIILDQFEEYFLYRPNETGAGTFGEEFPRAVNDLALRARFLISLRDDALSKLDFFKPQIPTLFNNLLRIGHMNGVAAKDAIRRPLVAYNDLYLKGKPGEHYSIEPLLVDEVINQVATDQDAVPSNDTGHLSPDKQATRIETPYLQLVMTRLWDKEREEKSRVLRLQTLEDLKGIKNIVQVHLNDALKMLSPEQQVIAARIFDYLVTPSGTKIAYFKSDLLLKTKIATKELDGVLEALNKSRILRPVDPPPDRPHEPRYEVFHDVLAQAILIWQTHYTQAAELVEAERQRRAEALARQARVLRRLVAALVLVVLGAVGIALYASRQRSQAIVAQKNAEESMKVASEQSNLAVQRQGKLLEQQTAAKHASEMARKNLQDALDKEKTAKEEANAAKGKLAKFLAEREQQIGEVIKENPALAARFKIEKAKEVDATQPETLVKPTGDRFQGTSRKIAKLSIAEAKTEEFADLKDLIDSLPSDAVMKALDIKFNTTSDRVAEEKRNVRVKAFIYAASGQYDNDFALIVGRDPNKSPEMYMTTKVSGLPPSSSEFFNKLKSVRNAFKKFLGDDLPGLSYDFYDPPIPVEIEGSLFWNASRASGTRPGPRSLMSRMPVLWEVHPVTKIVFPRSSPFSGGAGSSPLPFRELREWTDPMTWLLRNQAPPH